MFLPFKFANNLKTAGFSLLEIVVTISLVAVSLVAIISVATKILQVENVTENDFIAKGLLTECLELAEAHRNYNVTSSLPFYTDLTNLPPLSEGQVYTLRIDYNNDFTQIGINGNGSVTDASARLNYDATNFYQYASGTPSKFYRMLKTSYHAGTTVHSTDYLDLECQLYWADRGRGSTQKLYTTLSNTANLH